MATLTSIVTSTNTVKIIVSIDIGDIMDWAVYIYSKQDHGLGSSISATYPYTVERITGSGTFNFSRTYSKQNYVAELALKGYGIVDYTMFDLNQQLGYTCSNYCTERVENGPYPTMNQCLAACTTPIPVTINTIVGFMTDEDLPRLRKFIITGTGTGEYRFYQDGLLVTTRTLNNGYDTFNLENIPVGTHTYNTNPVSKGGSITIIIKVPVEPPGSTLVITSIILSSFITSDNRTVVKILLNATGEGEYRIKIDGVIEWGSHKYPDETSVLKYDLEPGSTHNVCTVVTRNLAEKCGIVKVLNLPTPPIVHKELVTNLTSDENLIKAALFTTGSVCDDYVYAGKYQEGSNWVFKFDIKENCKLTEFGAGGGLLKFIVSNSGRIAILLATAGIAVIVWMWRDVATKEIELKGELSDDVNNEIENILSDTSLTPEQKTTLIHDILETYAADKDNGWLQMVMYGVLVLGAAYIIGQVVARKR